MGDDRIERLERLAKLRDEGSLSQSEFEVEKARVLGASDRSTASKAPASNGDDGANPLLRNRALVVGGGAVVVAVLGALVAWGWTRDSDRRSIADDAPVQASAPLNPEAANAAAVSPSPLETSGDVANPPVSVAPKITGDWQNYRKRIREGWGTAPDFAGRYVIIRMGCGAGCTFGIVGDHQTGQLYDLGLGGEEQMYLDLRYGNDSNILSARWDDYQSCFEQDFIWTGTYLSPLGTPRTKPRGYDACDMDY